MRPGCVGSHPISSRVNALEAGLSDPIKPASQVKCSPASSGEMVGQRLAKCLHGAAIDVVSTALEVVAGLLQERRQFARQRQAVIAANPELQERELIKLASLTTALTEALRRRGVGDPAASLASQAGIAAFRTAFEGWIDETNQGNLSQLIRDSLDELKAITAGT